MKGEKEIRKRLESFRCWRVLDATWKRVCSVSLECDLEAGLLRVDRPRRSSPPPAAHRRTSYLGLVEMRNGAAHKLCQELHTSTQRLTAKAQRVSTGEKRIKCTRLVHR